MECLLYSLPQILQITYCGSAFLGDFDCAPSVTSCDDLESESLDETSDRVDELFLRRLFVDFDERIVVWPVESRRAELEVLVGVFRYLDLMPSFFFGDNSFFTSCPILVVDFDLVRLGVETEVSELEFRRTSSLLELRESDETSPLDLLLRAGVQIEFSSPVSQLFLQFFSWIEAR